MNKFIFDNLEPADKLRKLNEILKEKDKLEDNTNVENFKNIFPNLNFDN